MSLTRKEKVAKFAFLNKKSYNKTFIGFNCGRHYTIVDYWGIGHDWYRPESTNIYQGGAEVNIGILRSISHHVQCLNSQQLFYYIISLSKKSNNNNNKILAIDYVLDSLEFLFLHDD